MATETRPRFSMFAPIIKATDGGDGKPPRISCTCSSSEPDLAGDVMSRRALEQMRQEFAGGMTIFTNHKYVVPEDVFGRVLSAALIQRDFLDLDLEIAVDETNPRAMATFAQIQNGVKLGVSVGVLVSESQFVKGADGVKRLQIDGVTTLEASIVGIPANRRSWVQGALKAASAAFYGVPFLTDGSNIDDPVDASELELAKVAIRAFAAALKIANREIEQRDATMNELAVTIDRMMDMPLPRKTNEALVDAADEIANKYRWLAPEIAAVLAKSGGGQ